eukprot:TRINITY_DN42086_c0_g1_i1.p2 TRINITY_DN42086_c0_g1~~TRINITY_DN42086_c0_g1_i1.p2  ORF type:complete len:120 (-),score=7.90 TRINITY_DN42086_c0_g1_i1:10-369(-)
MFSLGLNSGNTSVHKSFSEHSNTVLDNATIGRANLTAGLQQKLPVEFKRTNRALLDDIGAQLIIFRQRKEFISIPQMMHMSETAITQNVITGMFGLFKQSVASTGQLFRHNNNVATSGE